MDRLINLTNGIPQWIILGAALIAAAIIAVIIIYIISRKKIRRFTTYLNEALENDNFSTEIYSPAFIKRHSKNVEHFAGKNGSKIILLSGLDTEWLNQLKGKPTEKNIKKILKFIPDQGLFSCFLAVQKRSSLGGLLLEYLGEEPGSLRKLPLSGSGEPFDGETATHLFRDRMDEIREMAGDPEWSVRYFAVKLLLNENSDRAKRGILEAFEDPHPLVRKSVIEECLIDNRAKIYDLLKGHLLNDPSFEVRKAAYRRIISNFKDIHSINYSTLTAVQALHALEFLNPDMENDIDAGLRFLEGKDLELRFPSAMFLQECGVLGRMLKEVSFEDTKIMERTTELLSNAAEVKVTGFLSEKISSSASLYTALSILRTKGDRRFITDYISRVFNSHPDNDQKIWQTAVKCAIERGNEAAVIRLLEELKRAKYSEELSVFILENIPGNIEHLSFNILIDLLEDINFNQGEALVDAITRIPAETVLPELFRILKGGRTAYPHKVRISALKVLARYKLPYCLQPIIEQLPTLPVTEAKEFSALMAEFAGDTFNERILMLLNQPDGKVRAAVIASLPGTGNKDFIKPIKAAFSDADPDVRIASIWALAEYEETKQLNQAFEMLRDPIERVRVAAAEVLGKFGNEDKLKNFSSLLRDENEVDEVKRSAVKGLGKSEQNQAVDILVELIDENEKLEEYAVRALAGNPTKKALTRIIENMKDASPVLRDKIMNIFRVMGEVGEAALMKLLSEDISSLKDSITDILGTTGYVEHVVRKLSHRDPRIRKSADELLSLIGTKPAFRGIVLAARDPDQDVRVQVTRALEKLSSKSGEEILEALKSDPDKRVRKFTMWALARTKAKSIED